MEDSFDYLLDVSNMIMLVVVFAVLFIGNKIFNGKKEGE